MSQAQVTQPVSPSVIRPIHAAHPHAADASATVDSTTPDASAARTTATGAAPAATANSVDGHAVKPRRKVLWIALAAVFGIAALGLGWNKIHQGMPKKLADPADIGIVIPVPAKPASSHVESSTPTQSQNINAVANAPTAGNSSLADPTAMGAMGNAGHMAGVNKPSSATTLDDIFGKIKDLVSTVEQVVQGQKAQEERDAKMQADLDSLKQEIARLQARRTPAHQAAHAPVRPQAPQQPTPVATAEDSAQLLSVDVWDGKPSVVVGRGRGRDTDVRFLNEGDTQGRVTVKKADVGSQRAILSTGKGEIVMSRDQ